MKNLKRILLLCAVGLFMTSCCDCPSGDPENIISDEEAASMQSLFIENQHQFINIGLESQYPANESADNIGAVVTDIEDLQKYLIKIKEYQKENNIDKTAMIVYFAAVPDDTNTPKSTVFFKAAQIVEPESEIDPIYVPINEEFLPTTNYDRMDPLGNTDPKKDPPPPPPPGYDVRP